MRYQVQQAIYKLVQAYRPKFLQSPMSKLFLRDPETLTFVKGSAGAHQAHVQNFRAYLSKTAWTLGILCGKVQKSRLGIVIIWF